MSMAYCAVFG